MRAPREATTPRLDELIAALGRPRHEELVELLTEVRDVVNGPAGSFAGCRARYSERCS